MTMRASLNSWQALVQHAQDIKQQHMSDLFTADKKRFDKFSIQLPTMLLDYSKNLIDSETIDSLLALAEETEVCNWRAKMFRGDKINKTEDRAVLHTALRRQTDEPLIIDGENVTTHVQKQLAEMEVFVNKVRQGHWLGYSGKRITDIVNIGVGETMTAQDILEGRLIVEVGMAAVRPAEFIVLRFTHKVQES